ncbi:MAG: pyrroline-5-carboxylate reductase [Akkermansia sp.]
MKLGLIGTGKMGSALLRGALRSDSLTPTDVVIYDHTAAHTEPLVRDYPTISIASNPEELVNKVDVVILAVKPQGILDLLDQISAPFRTMIGTIGDDSPLFLSIAAGISLDKLERVAFDGARIIRVMPNTPALIGKGTSVYCLGNNATNQDAQLVESLLAQSGFIQRIDESKIDAVSAISGCGPAYMYVILDALSDAGVAAGLPRALALELATRTMQGSAELVLQSGRHPMSLRDDVTSPGGTTIAALNKLDQCGMRTALLQAVQAAYDQSLRLG